VCVELVVAFVSVTVIVGPVAAVSGKAGVGVFHRQVVVADEPKRVIILALCLA